MGTLILESFGINGNIYQPAKNLFVCRVSKIGNDISPLCFLR